MASVASIINGKKMEGDTLIFPTNFGKKARYGMIFMFAEYNYGQTRQVITEDALNYKGSVILPLPTNGLREVSSFNLADAELGMAGALAADVATGGNIAGLVTDATSISDSLSWENVGTGAASALNIVSRLGPGTVARGILGNSAVGQGIDLATGQTLNNFSALTFNGVSLRKHTFEWTFYPENMEDSRMINRIKQKFNIASHPEYVSGYGAGPGDSMLSRLLFKYPQMVLPMILIDAAEEYYYLYKPCLVNSVSFLYRSESGMAFVNGGKPASVQMTLELSETSVWTREDYTGAAAGATTDAVGAATATRAEVGASGGRR